MKTNLKNAAVLGCLLMTTVAQAQSIAQTTSEINAQATITRGAIDNVLTRMNEQRPSSQFRATDYHAQNKDFQNRIQKALVKFEDTLTKDIFAKAAFWMDQYNSVYQSTEFSAEQKRILLEQRAVNLKNQFETLSAEYQKAINEVYKLVPGTDMKIVTSKAKTKQMCRESDSDGFEVYLTSGGKVISQRAKVSFSTFDEGGTDYVSAVVNGIVVSDGYHGPNVSLWGYSRIDGTECKGSRYKDGRRIEVNGQEFITGFAKHFEYLHSSAYRATYPAIKGSCRSSICVGLRSGDMVNLLTQISTKLDRSISMKLASGEQVVLKGSRTDLTKIQGMLARTDYPETLPFDI